MLYNVILPAPKGSQYWVISQRGWQAPSSPREFMRRYGVDMIRAANWGQPMPENHHRVPGFSVLEIAEWRVYAVMRSRGIPAMRAYRTVKRRGSVPTFLALLLVEKFGQDGAQLAIAGAFRATFGIRRILQALDLPEELFPRRRNGWGPSADASMRLLRQVERAIPYVG